jgi:glutamate N-acetyltransferase / amino-acid N-acetyltransferase
MSARKSNRSGWQQIPGGITAAEGFLATGFAAGVKKQGLDLAVVTSTRAATGAAVFTTNCVQAAPVILSRENLALSRGRVRAILLNSGCANACTGDQGMRDAVRCAGKLASILHVSPNEILVASTGVIGPRLPARRIVDALPMAMSAASRDGGPAARAIMTTDTFEKTVSVEAVIDGKPVRIGGMAKGAGMIHPQMATMLATITTDFEVPAAQLRVLLRKVVARTFNCLTVDGDTSTNDMVALIANGASGARIRRETAAFFEEGMEIVCSELAKSIARDGEGATKFVEVMVSGARDFGSARRVAKAIAQSLLVKTALSGEQLNWGRILCAAGYSGVEFPSERVKLDVCGIPIYRNGSVVQRNYARAEAALKGRDLQIGFDLCAGDATARVWTCDLSREYVNINACYLS